MRIYVDIDLDGYVTGFGSAPLGEGSILLEVPENHGMLTDEQLGVWRVVDGEIVKDAAREEQLIADWENRPPPEDEQLKAENKALSDRVEFLESVLEEMIFSIYQ